MTKKSKHYIRSQINKKNQRRSQMNSLEVIESLQTEVKHSKSYKIQTKEQIEAHYIEANKLIWIALDNQEHKTSM